MHKLDVKALGLAAGFIWAFCIFSGGIAAIYGWADGFVKVMSSLYFGYGPSVLGAVIGAIWAFFDAFVGGALVAWLYNKLSK